MLLLRITSE